GTIVEATSGNTGIGLAYVARELGLKAVFTMPDSMSVERRAMLISYGAELVLTPAVLGMAGSVDKAKEICNERNAYFANQFGNFASVEAHFYTTAPEIFTACPNAKYVVCGVGSGGTAMGIKKYIIQHSVDCEVVAVEPKSSPLMTKGYAGSHKIQGIGANFIPELVKIDKFDKIVTVSDDDAIGCAKEIYQKFGKKCGISSGAAYFAAKELRKTVDGEIVVILPDNGDRYDSSLYCD
ncbi:MAG: cysteine synthase family protein, partial [Clostridia bacterium]